MLIYKITNIRNNKVYIGQTNKSIQQRFSRHINDALSGNLNTHFAKAIRLYGKDCFIIEQIDSANTQNELNKKEIYWIHYYNSIKNGYNETDNEYKSGGNTYKYKTPEELETIKEKLRLSKKGGNNPKSKKVKCKSIITNEELVFNSLSEMQSFFKETNHNFITRRCMGITKSLYKKEWKMAYLDADYKNFSIEKQHGRAKKTKITNLETNEEKIFESLASAERYFNVPNKFFSGKAYKYKEKPFFIVQNKFKIEILN